MSAEYPPQLNSPTEMLDYLCRYKKTEDTVFIIGGGPSVTKLIPDPSVLFDHDVICTNDGYKLFPNAMLIHFADKAWWSWHNKPRHNIKEFFHGCISSATLHKRHHMSPDEKRVICFFNGNKETGGVNIDINKLDGNNTGHQAINIATHMGYKQICLIGFDMHPDQKNTHWHKYHERSVNVNNFAKRILPAFKYIVPFEEQLGFKVYNLNRESAIDCFTFADLKDFI